MPAFSHLDEGTAEEVWRGEDRIRSAPRLPLDVDDLIVIAAHPDDETLGAAGLIRRVHECGGGVRVIVATDGEASHPRSPTHSPGDLAAIRRIEVTRAVHALAPTAAVHFLGFPDGGLSENTDALQAAVAAILGALPTPAERTLVVAPWSGDGHRDHRVVAECVGRAGEPLGLRHLGYPIWLWHWGSPGDVPWDAARTLALTPDEQAAKAGALRAHASQTMPLSDAEGDEPIVSAAMMEHFARDTEFYVVETGAGEAEPRAGATEADGGTLPAAFFDEFYARHCDPWGFETRWYEERKRAILLASLPSRDLGNVLEIGCSTGLITVELVARAAHVVAVDASAAALSAARERLGDSPAGVTLQRGAVPGDWPDGAFETIVLSEVGYYLSAADLERTISLVDAAMTIDGCLVVCHWRHPVAEYPSSGDAVHHALRSVESWETLVFHKEDDFVLEVFCRRPAVSVAHREGLR